jgi:hypothetical protein
MLVEKFHEEDLLKERPADDLCFRACCGANNALSAPESSSPDQEPKHKDQFPEQRDKALFVLSTANSRYFSANCSV